MNNAPPNRTKLEVEIPPGATHFAIFRLSRVNGHGKQEKLQGEPDKTGYVPDTWPVSEFSTAAVLARWGDGRYRVEWYGGDKGDRMKGLGKSFDVAAPRTKKATRKLSPAPEGDEPEEPIARASQQIASGQPLGILELLTLLESRTERADAKAEAKAERDRQFWAQQQTQQMSMLTTLMQTLKGGGSTAESDLLRREMQLDLDKKMFELRQELAADEEPEEPEEPGAREPPKDLQEAGERIGMAFLEQLEGAAPELVSKMIPRFLSMLKAQGMQPSPEMQARIAAAANGAHRS